MVRSAASQFRWANLLTYVAVGAAAMAIAFTEGPATRFWAGAGLAIAIACDLFDGRFARLFRRSADDQQVGVEIDSLADVIAFGATPAVCMVRVASPQTPLEWLVLVPAGLFYLLCILTRLAHFNVFQAGTGGFIGLPSNMPPLVFAFMLLWAPGAAMSSVALVIGGAAAVAGFHIRRPNPAVLYTILAMALSLAAAHIFRLARG